MRRSRSPAAAECSTMRRLEADGSARLLVPVDAKVEWIFALKAGLGFDYAEFGRIDEVGRSQEGAPATSLPGSVDLTLDGVRTARIKAVDSGGKPLPGVGFYNWLVRKEGRRSMVNVFSRRLVADDRARWHCHLRLAAAFEGRAPCSGQRARVTLIVAS